ncbi:MAG: efflux RND transporter periplasmic adaptor subunit, partial [Vulcanimicrobiaceae bacterium]
RADVAAAENALATAQAQGHVLGAQVSSAQARLQAAQIALAQGILRAPNDGVVLQVLRRAGEAVDPTTPVIELGPPMRREVTLAVPADQARAIRVGDRVSLALVGSASSGSSLGRVVAVVPAVDPATQASTIVVDGIPPGAIAGDAVSATITTAHRRGIVLPASAIVQDPQSGEEIVFVESGGRFSSRKVVVAASNPDKAEIASGLRVGERVATQGAFTLLAPSGS